MIVRRASEADHPLWATMLGRLHVEDAEKFEAELKSIMADYVGFLAFNGAGEPTGMVDAMVRNYAEIERLVVFGKPLV